MYVGKLQVGSASVVEISHNDQARSRGLWWGCGGVVLAIHFMIS